MNTLILNADSSPLSIVNYRRGIVISTKSYMNVLKYYNTSIRSERVYYRIPAVIISSKYVNIRTSCKPTKGNILKRDMMTCQYCGIKLNEKIATVDHIKPVCLFKRKTEANTWTNQVACCKKCNSKKGDSLLSNCNMRLISEPKEIKTIISLISNIPEWKEYLE